MRKITFTVFIIFAFIASNALSQNTAVGPYFNGIFPSETPGPNGAWEVRDLQPNLDIASPLKIIDMPSMENHILILSKNGELYIMDLADASYRQVLDISNRTLNAGEGGAVGMAIHPEFETNPDKQYVFVYYRHIPGPEFNKGYNRLSKFQWDPANLVFKSEEEEILIQQYDSHIWHNGGGMFFDNDGYFYVTCGDEGGSDEVDITLSTQRIDNGFFGGMLRLDVDNDPSRSHPIRRQPVQLATPPAGWLPTFSQGYSIPNDNPWLSPTGDHLEEFYAIGLRAPYTAFYDEITEQIWVGDVGSDRFEEINLIGYGTNHQWPYIEGEEVSGTYAKPDPLIGEERGPQYYYSRDVGTAIVGGGIYRGSMFPSLDEKFIFGDYTAKKILTIDQEAGSQPEVLINNVQDSDVELPVRPGVAAVSVLKNGMVLISVISAPDFTVPGKILYLANRSTVPDPPAKLSDIGAFKNMATLEVADGFIPYKVNSPLWSDGAIKTRYVAIPNDGTFDSPEEKITFSPNEEWEFPKGTVFLKHFDLQTDKSDPSSIRRLETRFFIVGENSSYGLTYKWNEEGTEAFLQQSRSIGEIELTDNGSPAGTQLWDYPSRANCMRCHNSSAKFVLGPNTLQFNQTVSHPVTGVEVNQLDYYNSLNAFDRDIGSAAAYPRGYPLQSNDASLDVRMRSYLDANCSYCHRENGPVNTVDMDLRYEKTRGGINLIRRPVQSMASTQEFVIKPGDHMTSELWVRDETRNENQMPPLASNLVDRPYIDSLAVWIDGLSQDTLTGSAITVGPNPIKSFIRIDAGPEWTPDYQMTIVDMRGIVRLQLTLSSSLEFIDVAPLEIGTYVLKIERGELRYVEKILKLE